MRHSPALLLIASFVAFAMPRVPYAQAQVVAQGGSALEAWRQRSTGMSSNAALAFYRVRQAQKTPTSPPATSVSRYPVVKQQPPRRIPQTGSSYRRPYFYVPVVGYHAPPVPRAPAEPGFTSKPFADARPAPNAVDRYWPWLMERREDPKTGLITWELP